MFPQDKREESTVRWKYHVAPYVLVSKKDGSIQRYIIDPTSSKVPMTVSSFEKFISPVDNGVPFIIPKENIPDNLFHWPRTIISFSGRDVYALHEHEIIPKTDKEKMNRALRELGLN